MLLYREYDSEKKLDRAWFHSTNVVYSECDDIVDGLKILRVTFKGGATYQYKDVAVGDYLMFMTGGLDGSNGKALNKYIKPKYEYARIEDRDINELNEEMNRLKEAKANNKVQKAEEGKKDVEEDKAEG
jgi:hypothetical protein